MKKWNIVIFMAWVWTTNVGLAQDTYTLKDVIDASPQIAQWTPSLLSAPFSGTSIKVNGKLYELRLFTFEQKGIAQTGRPTFKAFITEWQQLATPPKQRSEALTPTDYFTATPEMVKKGYFFLLSLREVTEPKLIDQMKSREFSHQLLLD